MDGDWAEVEDAGDLGVGQLSIPDVELPEPLLAATPPLPRENAWTRVEQSNDVRRATGDARKQGGLQGISPRVRETSQEKWGPVGAGGPPMSKPHTGARFASMAGTQVSGSADRDSSSGSGGWSGSHSNTSVYMGNLPYETKEDEIVSFFSEFAFGPGDITLQYRTDTDQVFAATVKFRDSSTAKEAMRLDGSQVGGRTAHLSLGGSDRRSSGGNRGGGFSSGNFVPHGFSSPPGYGESGQRGQRERRSYGSSGFGGPASRDGSADGSAFGSGRERKGYGGQSGQFEPAGQHHGGGGAAGGRDRDEGGSRDRRGSGAQAVDPTIPHGPTPEGRKKLQLKPRTKPPPKLEIDTRTIDMPSRSQEKLRPGQASNDSDGSPAPARSGPPWGRTEGGARAAAFRTQDGVPENTDAVQSMSAAVPSNGVPVSNGVGGRSRSEEEKEKFRVQNSFAALDTEETLQGDDE